MHQRPQRRHQELLSFLNLTPFHQTHWWVAWAAWKKERRLMHHLKAPASSLVITAASISTLISESPSACIQQINTCEQIIGAIWLRKVFFCSRFKFLVLLRRYRWSPGEEVKMKCHFKANCPFTCYKRCSRHFRQLDIEHHNGGSLSRKPKLHFHPQAGENQDLDRNKP